MPKQLRAPRKCSQKWKTSTRGGRKGVFDPSRVGERGYSKDEASFERRRESARAAMAAKLASGKMGRPKGVRDGMSGRGGAVAQLHEEAELAARKSIETMVESGQLSDEAKGNEALEAAFEIIKAKDPETKLYLYHPTHRLAAMRLVAEFMKTRPVVRQETELKGAEAFLLALKD